MRTPLRAAWAMPARIAAGVPSARAQGEAATSRVLARKKELWNGTPRRGGTTMSKAVTINTPGTKTRSKRSTVVCVGDFCVGASSTIFITRASVLSFASRATFTSSAPWPLTDPAQPASPGPLPDTHEEEKQGALRPPSEDRRADRRAHHQDVGVEPPFTQRVPGMAGDVRSAQGVNPKKEQHGQPMWGAEEGLDRPARHKEHAREETEEELAVLLQAFLRLTRRDAVAERADPFLDGVPVGCARVELDTGCFGRITDDDGEDALRPPAG